MSQEHLEKPVEEPRLGPVLIAIDPSQNAEMTFDWYISTFHRPEHMSLVLYHVVDLPPAKSVHNHADVYMGGAEWQQLMEQLKTNAKHLEDRYKSKLAKLKINARVKTIYYAKPGEALAEAAAKENTCLIVMGARGTSTTRRTIIGSVTDYVLKHAHCPVTVYRCHSELRGVLAGEEDRHGSFSKLLRRLTHDDKPRSRSNSFDIKHASKNSSRSSSRNSSRAPSPTPESPLPCTNGVYKFTGVQ